MSIVAFHLPEVHFSAKVPCAKGKQNQSTPDCCWGLQSRLLSTAHHPDRRQSASLVVADSRYWPKWTFASGSYRPQKTAIRDRNPGDSASLYKPYSNIRLQAMAPRNSRVKLRCEIKAALSMVTEITSILIFKEAHSSQEYTEAWKRDAHQREFDVLRPSSGSLQLALICGRL